MDIVERPGRGIGRDIAKGEAVEHDLDRFIQMRHAERVANEGERKEHEEWIASRMRLKATRREQNRLAWCDYHRDTAESLRRILEGLIASHEAAAARLTDNRTGAA